MSDPLQWQTVLLNLKTLFISVFSILPRPRQSFDQRPFNHLIQGVNVLLCDTHSLNNKRDGLGWVDASDDCKVVFGEVEAPPMN